jgi:hypothetical protein
LISLYEDKFQRGTDYKKSFTLEVDKLIKQDLTTEFKNKLIQSLTDAYVDQTGEVPDSYELTRLGSWIVEDKVNDPDKVTNTEFPILSEGQHKLRLRRESPNQVIESFSSSSRHKLNGKRKPKSFKVFGEYEGGY